MSIIDQQLLQFKHMFESAIITGGEKGKQSIIRSSSLINLIHDAVKQELIDAGVDASQIFPRLYNSKPEVKLAGFLKQKDQDICVLPSNMSKQQVRINWGPMAFQNKVDPYGYEYSTNSLVINVRSQMSSIAKNSDTLFERTFAEAMNLHMRFRDMVLGEVYVIPVHEYDDDLIKLKQVGFKTRQTDLEKYISFFDSVNNRPRYGADYEYERCTLLIVDFNLPQPRLFNNSAELKEAGYLPQTFGIEYATLGFRTFVNAGS